MYALTFAAADYFRKKRSPPTAPGTKGDLE